jgi:N-(5-amino-5-carboxypentanoyl)-L-cysteinyl-D-valine synthase
MTGEDYVAPRNDVELALRQIWSELLDMPPDAISIYSDFFSLGGDSLKSTKLSFVLTKTFGLDVTVRNFFNNRTIEAMAHLILNNAVELNEIQPLSREQIDIPVSFAQERILFINEFENGESAYNIAIHLQTSTAPNEVLLEESLRFLVVRHESLRTLLIKSRETGQYNQKLLNKDEAQSMVYIRCDSAIDAADLDHKLNKIEKYTFQLDKELPLKIYLHRLLGDPNNLVLSLVAHHTCFDSWSWEILRRDLTEYYAYLEGLNPKAYLPPLKIQYKEYAIAHRSQMSGSFADDLKNFWRVKLRGFEQLHLVTDYPRPAKFDYRGDDVCLKFKSKITDGLISLAKQEKVSLYCLLLAIYCFLLRTYTNQTDIVVGVPISNRNRPEYEHIVGFFVNMLVLRTDLSSQKTINELIQTVHGELISIQMHQDLPFQETVNAISVTKDPGRHPIVQTILNFEYSEMNPSYYEESGLQFSQYHPQDAHESNAKFDLNATATLSRIGLEVNFNYATSLFTRTTIDGILQTYGNLLGQIASLYPNGVIPLKTLQLTPHEQQFIAGTQTNADTDKQGKSCEQSLSQIFEKEVQLVPDRIAIVQGGRAITYHELNEHANQLARYLEEVLTKIRPEDKIAAITIISTLLVLSNKFSDLTNFRLF